MTAARFATADVGGTAEYQRDPSRDSLTPDEIHDEYDRRSGLF
jgi:hypothetical protein